MESIGIIGYGRFGKLLANILKEDFEIIVYDTIDLREEADKNSTKFSPLEKTLECPTIFYCTPIAKFEEIFKSHLPLLQKLNSSKTLIDVMSVKVHPKKIFEKYLPANFEAMLTHPMFGPDSYKQKDKIKLPIVIDKFKTSEEKYLFWKQYFISKQFEIVELSAEDHDKMAANSQGITHFIGRVLEDIGMEKTPIDTLGAKKLLEIKEQTCNDSWELFTDLQTKNPYTKQMRVKLGLSVDNIYNRLLPNRIDQEKLVVGIQGGPGSFNEQASLYYLDRNGENSYKIEYLFTTENVLKALHQGDIDRGQFAIHNSVGGVVEESIKAMADYKFNIVEEFSIKISHTLMTQKNISLNQVDTIMTHPQVLKQCKNTLAKKYARFKLTSGEGDLIDHANVAKLMSCEKLSPNIATIGSKILADMYNLRIVEENLQDLTENYTTFLWVQRPVGEKTK